MTFAIHLQRTTVRPCIKLFIWFLVYVHKGRGHYLPVYLQKTLSLFPVLFTKDAVLVFCYSRFVYKGLQPWYSLLKGRCPFLCYSFAKDRCPCICYSFAKDAVLVFAIHLQRTAVFVWCYAFAKDCRPCLMLFIYKGRSPFLMLFTCKGLRYLFCAISLQRKLLFLLSIRCPGKIRWIATLAKHGETASSSGFVKMAVTQINT